MRDDAKGGRQFGSTAVQLGYLSDAQVSDALAEQSQRRAQGGGASPIGALLQEKGLLTPQQITAVLRQLTAGTLPLSEDGIRLAARLKTLHAAAGNVIGVTGSVPSDVARATVELAVGLAVMEQGQVLLVDANLRAPSLHALLETPSAPGLLDHIAQGEGEATPLATRVAALGIVPCGGERPDPIAACMSPEAGRVIESYRARHRYVLVNLGLVSQQPEAAVTASRCDGVLVVLRAGVSQKAELRDLQRMLAGLRVPLSGVVLVRPATRRERSG